jgi:hypothetical protein
VTSASIAHGLLVAVNIVAIFAALIALVAAGERIGDRIERRCPSMRLAAPIGGAFGLIVWIAISAGVLIAVTNPGPMS